MSITNECRFRGNFVREPEVAKIKTADGGEITKVNFRLAINNRRGGATFVDCEAFRQRAEAIARLFKKGDEIWVMGELRTDSWTDKEGQNRSRLVLNIDNFEFGRRKPEKAGEAAEEVPDFGDDPDEPVV